MRLLLALILAAGLVGCEQRTEQPSQPAPPEVAKAPDVQKPESKIEPPVQEKRNPEKGGNPKRLYQLADLRKGTVKLDGKPIEVWVMDS